MARATAGASPSGPPVEMGLAPTAWAPLVQAEKARSAAVQEAMLAAQLLLLMSRPSMEM